jgi:hypothetical protein
MFMLAFFLLVLPYIWPFYVGVMGEEVVKEILQGFLVRAVPDIKSLSKLKLNIKQVVACLPQLSASFQGSVLVESKENVGVLSTK